MWFLEGYLDGGERLQRVVIRHSPWTAGRAPSSDLLLTSERVSFNHAVVEERSGSELWILDQGSLNGTFINLHRVHQPQRLDEGDIVHFADQEFRIGQLSEIAEGGQTMILSPDELQSKIPGKTREFRIMLQEKNLEAMFQPIVSLVDESLHAYEQLGRGMLGGESKGASELFAIAESIDLQSDLSESFRQCAIEVARKKGVKCLFVNTHPEELLHPDRLIRDMEAHRREAPDLDLVIEIHESAAPDLLAMKELGAVLADLNIDIAFDDFGTGQARLMELADATPKYVKFDISWLADSDAGRRQALMAFLITLCRDLGIVTIAEGIETAEQAEMIREMKFDLAQGYYFGRPAPLPQ